MEELHLPKPLRISTRTATSKINSTIDLKILYDNLELDENIKYIEYGIEVCKGESKKILSTKKKEKKKVFFNQITILIKLDYLYNNIKLFNNGSISMTGVKSEIIGKKSVELLFDKLIDINSRNEIFNTEEPKIEFYKIVLINSDYDIGYEIKRSELHQILVNDYNIYSSYEPCIYPGVNSKYFWNRKYKNEISYPLNGKCYCDKICTGKGNGNGDGECKKVTISAFQSGSVIITGANSIEQIKDCYDFINKIFKDNYQILKKENPLNLESSNTKKKMNKIKNNIIYIKKDNIIYKNSN
jgi:TATA-box binding protein (TBP) (component of TFIID and TFIIIB)